MTNEELLALYTAIEADFPVDSWEVLGVQLWPLVRAGAFVDNFYMFQRAREARAPAPAGRAPWIAAAHALRPRIASATEIAGGIARGARARVQDRAMNDRLRPVDALLYSDGVSFVNLDGRQYERFCEPVAERLAARGLRSLLVTPLTRYPTPRHCPSVFIQPSLEVARVRARAKSRPDYLAQIAAEGRTEGFADAVRAMRERAPNGNFRDLMHYARVAVYLRGYQDVYARVLDRATPSAVFIVCYYGTEPMALIRECRARQIATVDLQHGTINDAHFAYAKWTRVPKGGFDLLPDFFWVWSEEEAGTIRAWSARVGRHRPILGGNPFLAIWQDDEHPEVRRADAQIAGFERYAAGAGVDVPNVLYTANGFEGDAELDRLGDAIRRSEGRLYWWVRMHPVHPGERAQVDAKLRARGAKSFRVDKPTGDAKGAALPLYAVLRHMSAHVTESSSTVIEAALFGVPSVLLSAGEAVMYQRWIDDGWATVLASGVALEGAVLAQIGRKDELRARHPRPTTNAHEVADRALDGILGR